jgi:catechol 2,3-dioxygenase-like lactoylglutathione lyase family enzyme
MINRLGSMAMSEPVTSLQTTMPLEIGIACRNLEAQRNFYEAVLGLSFVSEVKVAAQASDELGLGPHGYTVIRLQTPRGERIKLLRPVEAPRMGGVQDHLLSYVGICYLTFGVSDLAAEMRRLLAAGVAFSSGTLPKEVRPGVHVGFCSDPEGNAIELVQIDALA